MSKAKMVDNNNNKMVDNHHHSPLSPKKILLLLLLSSHLQAASGMVWPSSGLKSRGQSEVSNIFWVLSSKIVMKLSGPDVTKILR